MAKFQPTTQQVNVTNAFNEALNKQELISIFLNAVAGSGKTSTVMLEVEQLMNRNALKACSLSFNTNIRDASQVKLTAMGSAVQARTTNQLGRAILVNAAKLGLCRYPGKLDNSKYRAIVEKMLAPYMRNKQYFPKFQDFSKAITATVKLIEGVRSTRVEATEERLLDIVAHYKLENEIDTTAPAWPLIAQSVEPAIAQGILEYEQTGLHDFNDQICLPLDLDVAAPEWDVIFIDEAQDLNRARLEMIVRSIKPQGVLFFVGDPQQAIQGFTFADTQSVETIKQVTNAIEYPLSVCWRCDENIIKLAQVLVPHIQARPGAKEGTIDVVDPSSFISKLQTGYKRGEDEKDPDLVLCRVKAPLVEKCLEAIREGKSAIVRGRDIGRNIVALLDDILPAPMKTLHDAIEVYTWKQIEKLAGKKDAETKIDELHDRIDTLVALLDGYLATLESAFLADIDDFKTFINSKFADDEAITDGVKPIVFSTIHKAKGLEYDRVFILEPGKLPHPAAKMGWQLEQEYNIIYVAVTRAKHELYFVGGVPACLSDTYHEIKGDFITVEEMIREASQSLEEPVVTSESTENTSQNEEAVSEAPESVSEKVETRGRKNLNRHHVHVTLKEEIFQAVKKTGVKDLGKLMDDLLEEWLKENGSPFEQEDELLEV